MFNVFHIEASFHEAELKYLQSGSTHVVPSIRYAAKILSMLLVSTLNSISGGQVQVRRYRRGWRSVPFFGPDGGSYDIKRGDDYQRFHVKIGFALRAVRHMMVVLWRQRYRVKPFGNAVLLICTSDL